MGISIKVADEVWIGCALLHYENHHIELLRHVRTRSQVQLDTEKFTHCLARPRFKFLGSANC